MTPKKTPSRRRTVSLEKERQHWLDLVCSRDMRQGVDHGRLDNDFWDPPESPETHGADHETNEALARLAKSLKGEVLSMSVANAIKGVVGAMFAEARRAEEAEQLLYNAFAAGSLEEIADEVPDRLSYVLDDWLRDSDEIGRAASTVEGARDDLNDALETLRALIPAPAAPPKRKK